MTHFTQIRFAQTKTRRHKTLSEVMPQGAEWRYFVVLSDAYLSTEAGEVRIRSFSDLQRAMSRVGSLQALLAARASGRLTEGRHELPDVLVSCLAQSDTEPSNVRRWRFGASESSTMAIDSSELAAVWAGSDTEELEAVDQSANWYFRMKDDEPLTFLAVRDQTLLERIGHCDAYCVEVGGDFEYAR